MKAEGAQEEGKKSNDTTAKALAEGPAFVLSPRSLETKQQKANNILNTLAQGLVKEKLFTRYIQSTESDTSFHLDFFLKAFIIHFLFFVLLGPFMLLIYTPIFGWTLMRNMQFVVNLPMITQNLLWLINFSTLVFYILYGYPELLEYYVMQLFFILVRSIVIALRYGYTSVELMTLYHTTDIVTNDGRGMAELLINGWLSPSPKEVMAEIKSALWRSHVDCQEFMVRFRNKVPQLLHDKLTISDYYIKHEYSMAEDFKVAAFVKRSHLQPTTSPVTNSQSTSSIYPISDKLLELERQSARVRPGDTLYSGEALLRELILMAKIDSGFPMFVLVLALVHGLLPFLLTLIDGSIMEYHWSIIVCMVGHFLVSLLINVANALIAGIAYVDYARRLRVLQYLSDIISVNKRYGCYFPRLDLNYPLSWISWYQLRVLALDCGKKYQKRVNAYNSLFLISYCIYFCFIILYYFDVMKLNLSIVFQVLSWYDLVLFLGLLAYIFYIGILVNHQCGVHQTQILEQKQRQQWFKLVCKNRNKPTARNFPWNNPNELPQQPVSFFLSLYVLLYSALLGDSNPLHTPEFVYMNANICHMQQLREM